MGLLTDTIGATAGVTVETEDGSISVAGVTTLKVPDGTLTDNSGSVSVTYPQINGASLDAFAANLVASWNCDDASGNLDDAQTGSHDLVVSGSPTYSHSAANSVRGTSVKGASTGYWVNATITLPSTGDFTINYWLRYPGGGGFAGVFLSPDETVQTSQIGMHFFANDIYIVGDAGATLANTSSNPLTSNIWHMITFQRVSGEYRAFVDATQHLSTSTQGTDDWSTSKFVLGRDGAVYAANNGFDEVLFYDVAISAAAITELFNLRNGVMVGDPTPPTPPSATQLDLVADRLFAYYGCADNSPLSDDYLGQHDITLLAGTPTNTTGKNGNCVSLDATTSYTVDDAEKNFSKDFVGAVGDDFSINFWVNISSFATARRGILGFATSPTSSTVAKGISVEVTTGALRFDGNAGTALITGSALSTSTWHMVTFSFDTAGTRTWRLWLDGVADGTTTSENTQNLSAIDFHIGRIFNLYANGGGTTLLDEISIWKTALNATAVSELYNSGTGRFSA